jgi:hypothetical protein
MEAIEIYHEPILRKPFLVAAWPGISNVALRAASYLKEKLGAEEFAELKLSGFFGPAGVLVRDNVVEMPRFPQSKFYYWQGEAANDIIIYLAEAQPAMKQYEFAHLVLDVAERFHVERVYTFAAAVSPHRVEKPKVWGAATDAWLIEELKRYDVVLKGDYQIRGLNGLLLAVAKERGIPGICLLGETSQYYMGMENPMASHTVLRALVGMLGIDVDLSEMEKEARRVEAEVEKRAKETMTGFIDLFTQPIWERKEEEEEENE